MFLDVLNSLMQERKINKSILAHESKIPYTTIDGFYKKGCDNVKLSTLQKLSDYFGVTLDFLVTGNNVILTGYERKIITAYRNNPELQYAVDRLLGVAEPEAKAEPPEEIKYTIAARGGKEIKKVTDPKEKEAIDKLFELAKSEQK